MNSFFRFLKFVSGVMFSAVLLTSSIITWNVYGPVKLHTTESVYNYDYKSWDAKDGRNCAILQVTGVIYDANEFPVYGNAKYEANINLRVYGDLYVNKQQIFDNDVDANDFVAKYCSVDDTKSFIYHTKYNVDPNIRKWYEQGDGYKTPDTPDVSNEIGVYHNYYYDYKYYDNYVAKHKKNKELTGYTIEESFCKLSHGYVDNVFIATRDSKSWMDFHKGDLLDLDTVPTCSKEDRDLAPNVDVFQLDSPVTIGKPYRPWAPEAPDTTCDSCAAPGWEQKSAVPLPYTHFGDTK